MAYMIPTIDPRYQCWVGWNHYAAHYIGKVYDLTIPEDGSDDVVEFIQTKSVAGLEIRLTKYVAAIPPEIRSRLKTDRRN